MAYQTAAEYRLVNPEILAIKRQQSTREKVDLRRYGTPNEQIINKTRNIDPRNWDRWPGRYDAYADIKKVQQIMESGVAEKDLHEFLFGRGPQFDQIWGKYPGQTMPGLEPGENALQKFIQYHKQRFKEHDERSFLSKTFDIGALLNFESIPFLQFFSKSIRDEENLIKGLEQSYGESSGSETLSQSYGQSSQGGAPVVIEVGGVRIEIDGSNINSEEQAQTLADALLNLLGEVNSTMELESYQNSDLSTLHRNVNVR